MKLQCVDIIKEITDIAVFKAGDYDELEMVNSSITIRGRRT